MPIIALIKNITRDGQKTKAQHACVLMREGDKWSALDPENNNTLISGVSTNFLREEQRRGRLVLPMGWDAGLPSEGAGEQP